MSVDIGIDLGTASVLVYVRGKGVVLKEPSVVAFDRDTNVIKAIGEEARMMLGRTPGNIVAVRPLRQGVISDYTVTEKMIKYFVQKALGKRTFKKPRISICVPSGVTEVEKKAVEEATFAAGAREVHLIEEPVAAAIGAGIDIAKPCGNMIVDIGGGTADIAVISLGGTVVNTSIKVAGDDFDEAIVRYMRKKHNLLIGERTAEDIKIKIGTTYPLVEEETMEVRGRNLVTGLPKTVTVTSSETEEALREATSQIVEAVISVLEQTPPELSADILDRGIVLTGGEVEKSARPVAILKAGRAREAYGQMLLHYAAKCLLERFKETGQLPETAEASHGRWINFGGQPLMGADADALREDIREGRLNNWDDIHRRLDALWAEYPQRKLEHAFGLTGPGSGTTSVAELLDKERNILELMFERAVQSRAKDFANPFRAATCRSLEETAAVFGTLEDDASLARLKKDAGDYMELIEILKDS